MAARLTRAQLETVANRAHAYLKGPPLLDDADEWRVKSYAMAQMRAEGLRSYLLGEPMTTVELYEYCDAIERRELQARKLFPYDDAECWECHLVVAWEGRRWVEQRWVDADGNEHDGIVACHACADKIEAP